MLYKCPRCHYSTNKHCNIKSHLIRKISCPPKYSNNTCDMLLHNKELLYSEPDIRQLVSHSAIIDVPDEELLYYCRYCDKPFKHCSSKSKHERLRCKHKKKQLVKQLSEREERMEHLITSLREQVKQLATDKNCGYVITDNSTNINNNQLINNVDNSKHLQINNYGKEDISYITDEKYKEILKNPYSAMSKLMN